MRRLLCLIVLLALPGLAGAQERIRYYPPASSTNVQTIYNVKTYGATGNGTTDDSAAIQAALTAVATNIGGVVYLPAGTYKVATSLTVKSYTTIRGEKVTSSQANAGTIIDASSIIGSVNFKLFTSGANAWRIAFEDLKINLAAGANVTSQGTVGIGIIGVSLGTSSSWTTLKNVYCSGGNGCFLFNASYNTLIEDCQVSSGSNFGVAIINGSKWAEIRGGLFQNSGHSDQSGNGNIVIGAAATVDSEDIIIKPYLVDEAAGASIHVWSGINVHIQLPRIYSSATNATGTGPGYGIKVGSSTSSPTRVTIIGTRIEPFGAGQPDATILLYGSGHRLIGVSTSTTNPVDILDNAKDTQYIDVNGSTTQFQNLVADAVMPFGSVVMPDASADGRFDINTGSATLSIGVVQGNTDTAQGTSYPVVSDGRAYIRQAEDQSVTRGHYLIMSATAGLVNDSATVTTIGLNIGKALRSEAVTATINHAGCTGGSGCINTALDTPSAGPAGQFTLGVDVAALGWAVGDAVAYWNSGGATPTGLTDGQVYFLASVSTTKVTLTATKGSTTIVVPSSQGNDATQYLVRLPLAAVNIQ